MANAGYIVVKGDGDKVRKQGVEAFFGPHDKGSAKPSFCYPKQKEDLKRKIDSMEKSLSDGYVAENRRMAMRLDIKKHKERLDAIECHEADVKTLVKNNKDALVERRNQLAEEIANRMPTAKAVEKHKVNPFRIYNEEKKGGLGEKKREFQIISHALGEESNTHFLQKD